MKNGALRCAVFFGASILVANLTACRSEKASAATPDLAPAESKLVSEAGFDVKLIARVRAHGTALERQQSFQGADFQPVPGPGLVLVTKPGSGESVLLALRRDLSSTSYQAWLNDNTFGNGPDRIVILNSRDPYAYLASIPVNGTNYNIGHAQIVEQYRKWEARLGLRLTGGGGDWLSADITREPEDWLAFAREVYAFCPDIVDQGTNDVDTLAEEMRRRRLLYLWWD